MASSFQVVKTSSSLSVSEASFKAVVNFMVDGLIEIDGKGLVRAFNPAAEKLFGYLPDEVIGKNIRMLMPEPFAAGFDDYLVKPINIPEFLEKVDRFLSKTGN